MLIPLIATALMAVPQVPRSADPLAPAATCKVQCYQPDDRARTCRSMASYRRQSDGRYLNTAIVLVAAAGPMTLETVTPVTVEAGAVCGFIRNEDITAGTLRVGDRLLSAAEAGPVLARIAQSMTPVVGKAICTTYEATTDGSIARATIAGERRADADQRVRWLPPGHDYRVAP